MKTGKQGIADDSVRIQHIIARLHQAYPDAKIALRYGNTWELLVAVILSAQCTDKMVNTVTARLFTKYRTLDEYAKADRLEFERDIKSAGFFRTKARNILETAGIISTKYHGHVPDTMDALTSLPGVARKTANIVLGNAFNIVEGIAVDTHVHRISQRLRLVPLKHIGGKQPVMVSARSGEQIDYIKDADPVKIERELMKVLPQTEWFGITYKVIDHGRSVCKAQHPQCSACPLRTDCPVAR